MAEGQQGGGGPKREIEREQFFTKGIHTEPPSTRNGTPSSNPILPHFISLSGSNDSTSHSLNNQRSEEEEEMSKFRVCFCFWLRFRQTKAEAPEEVRELFKMYSENGAMGAEQLKRFLVEVQGEEEGATTREKAQSIIDSVLGDIKYPNRLTKDGVRCLGLDSFFRFLFGEANPPISPSLGVHHDMTAPLSHYFIYTSHNTYLTGNQLNSDCSDGPIIEALKRGVRVIELDMWPNVTNDNVDIYHGRTLTTPVELIKCLRSIREHAFSVSPYPVIITLEDHLTPDLQAKVAEMVTETFGDMLFYLKSDAMEEFPSPEELKMRIILSTKPPKEYHESKIMTDKGSGLDNEDKNDHDGREHIHDEEDHDDDPTSNQNTAPEYKRLITIHAGKPKGGLHVALRVDPNKYRRLSLSEQELEKAAESRSMELGYGSSLWLMHGNFRANGGCGYIKKPDFLLKEDENGHVFDPKAKLDVKKTLKVKVYLGDGWNLDFRKTHFDMCSPPDFYTTVGIAGVAADTTEKRTKTITDNWTPVWNEEFTFPLTVPELALLRIEVGEYDPLDMDGFGGQTCLPVPELRTGVRAVPLCNIKGEEYKSVKLLVRFEFV
ncbi:Phosphoinositide phospholipase C 2 [Acorus gramineus]|uniref:Phosphoinositide phospholipase C n=1 Tax=Acorus gramineus TaxID=55184 RepID=A0AAV9B490_ACOGR|nr:Phosphoinositide phospholipase C 2 [Acorus gramineus]